MTTHRFMKTAGVAALLSLWAGMAAQAQTILTTGNGIIRSSLCVGTDCQSGIPFVDSTIIVKENNTRIKFADTSVAASFPRNDWELEANSQTNGGPNRFSIFDCGENSNDGGCSEPDNVFSVEANAGSNALYVDDGGRVGFGTGTPVVELHVVDGDTPTLRLEQDGSQGFTPQTFDVAGNEANFFIRDVTNGSALPFRIQPGAPTNSISIRNGTGHLDGAVGMGLQTATAPLHVRRTDAVNALDPHALIQNTNATTAQRHLLSLSNKGTAYLSLLDTSVAAGDNLGQQWNIFNAGGLFRITSAPGGPGETEFEMDNDGNVTISGHLITTGGGGACTVGDPCDAVFDPAVYTVPSIEEHAALMWENKHLPAVGPTGPDQPIDMTEKMLRILNELEHAHIYIEQLHQRLEALETAARTERG